MCIFVIDFDLFVFDELIIGMDEEFRNEFYCFFWYSVYVYGKLVLMIIYDYEDIK